MSSIARICSVEGCENRATTKGLCNKHYARLRIHGDPLYERVRIKNRCTIKGCNKEYFGKGFCSSHYMKWYTYGSPDHKYVPPQGSTDYKIPKDGDEICSIEGCDYKVYVKHICHSHYRKVRKYGDPLGKPEKRVRLCSVDNCKKAYFCKGYCRVHYNRIWENGTLELKYEQHRMSDSPEYSIWCDMLSRCRDPKQKFYSYYGGRGIRVCDNWLNSFQAFFDDMGKRPTGKHTIDRIDNNGHYSCGKCEECLENSWPMNCRWATRTEQSHNLRLFKNNTSGYRGVYYDGKKGRLKRWYVQISVNQQKIYIGSFYTKNEAIEARKIAERKYWNSL